MRGAAEWKFFLGASFLTAALIVPHAGAKPVAAGIVLAALVRWGRSRTPRGKS
jgi:hypothetical protein